MPSDKEPVLPDRKTMMWIEDRLKRFQMQLGPMKRGPKRWPRKGGGGGSVAIATQYAVVTETASSSTYSGTTADGTFKVCLSSGNDIGKCVLLSLDGNNCYAMPELSGSQTMADYELNLQCVYNDVGLLPNYFIEVAYPNGSTSAIPQGPYGDDAPTVDGFYVQPSDFLRALNGYTPSAPQTLYHDENGVLRWSKVVC